MTAGETDVGGKTRSSAPEAGPALWDTFRRAESSGFSQQNLFLGREI